MFIRLCFS
ncbi:hypothetical protein VCHENC02_5412A, partial [Vibrio harveyi]